LLAGIYSGHKTAANKLALDRLGKIGSNNALASTRFRDCLGLPTPLVARHGTISERGRLMLPANVKV
jgi:hypothetical protein